MSERVAIIGAGPGGIAAARWLLSRGFEVKLYEAHTEIGGQWSWTNPNSGVWPQMVTNTFREATCFSDLAYPEGTPLFPHNSAVRQYLEDFARAFNVFDRITFNTRLKAIEQVKGGWRIDLAGPDKVWSETVPRVVIATGRFNAPLIPPIEGADGFAGDLGLIHSFNYKDPFAYQDKTVAVLGGSISSLEIASDLSMLGAKRVYLAQRRQRYVNPKMFLGTPIEYRLFTHERGRLALDDPEAFLADSEAKIMEHAGDPSHYGAPQPHADFAKAGSTGSQHYLNLVAEGRITPVGWPERVEGNALLLSSEEEIEVDGMVAGTGFRLNLPFLSDELRATLHLSETYIELDEYTMHPDLPGLAFIGFWSQAGSYPTPLEQQARFLAYTWSGELARDTETMRAGVEACRDEGHHSSVLTQSEMALRFARLCGTDPALLSDPDELATVRSAATMGLLYRLCGPDALPDALASIEALGRKYRQGTESAPGIVDPEGEAA